MSRPLLLAAVLPLFIGACAARSTVQMVQAEQAIYLAREADAPERAVYEYTLAQQYLDKAREEWSHSDYGPADEFSRKAIDWAGRAEEAAANSSNFEQMESSPDVVPEERQPEVVTEPMLDESGGEPGVLEEILEEEQRGVESETVEVPDVDLWGEEEDEEVEP